MHIIYEKAEEMLGQFSEGHSGRRGHRFKLPLCLLAAVAALGISSAAGAAEVFIAGFTNGAFGIGATPGSSASIPGMSFSNSTFSGTTAGGFRGLGSAPNPGANFNNLGSITLSTAPNTFNTVLNLEVTFTAPQGINGSNQALFVATVTGAVISDNVGGAFIDFDNTPVLFTWNDTNFEAPPPGQVIPGQQTTGGTGSMFFSVNDVSVDPGSSVPLTGQITGAQQVPEPSAAIITAGGMLLATLPRRRRPS